MNNQFEPIGHDYITRNFNDRRKQYGKGQEPPKRGNWRPDAGGTRVPRKPKPKMPMTPAKIKLK